MNTLNNPLAGLKKPAKPVMTREEFTSEAPMQIAAVAAEVKEIVESKKLDLAELDNLLNEIKPVEAPVKEKLKPETALLSAERKKMLEICVNKTGMPKAHVLAEALEEYFMKHILDR